MESIWQPTSDSGFHRSFWWDNTLIGKIDAKQQTKTCKVKATSKRLARQRSQRREELANAKVKTINTLYKEGSLPKELYERVTVRK